MTPTTQLCSNWSNSTLSEITCENLQTGANTLVYYLAVHSVVGETAPLVENLQTGANITCDRNQLHKSTEMYYLAVHSVL